MTPKLFVKIYKNKGWKPIMIGHWMHLGKRPRAGVTLGFIGHTFECKFTWEQYKQYAKELGLRED